MYIIVTLISLFNPMKLILVDSYLLLAILWIQFFHKSLINFLLSSILWFKDFQKPVSRVLFRVLSMNLSEDETLSQKHLNSKKKKKHIYEWQKYLKMLMVKIWLEFITMQLTKKFAYARDTYFKIINRIMTDNFIPGHILILCVTYNNLWNT